MSPILDAGARATDPPAGLLSKGETLSRLSLHGSAPRMRAIASTVPTTVMTTDELLELFEGRLSEELETSLRSIGVEQRHSVLANHASALINPAAQLHPTTSTTGMAVAAIRGALERADLPDAKRIGLLVSVSNTESRQLPGLGPEILAQDGGLLPRSVAIANLSAQGCATLLKGAELAGWYLCAHPDRLALLVAAEAHTPWFSGIPQARRYLSFRELRTGNAKGAGDERATLSLIQAALFGDGAVALVLEAEGPSPALGPFVHLTNRDRDDGELLTMDGGGTAQPLLSGRPRYTMAASVPRRGAAYAAATVKALHECVAEPEGGYYRYLIHTGSRKILNGVCDSLGLSSEDPRVRTSYDVLGQWGNLSAASIGFMLEREPNLAGPALLSAFGVGFSASAGKCLPAGYDGGGRVAPDA